MAPVCAHIGGLPVEETVIALAPGGVAVLVALRMARERTRGWARSVARAGGGPVNEHVTTISRRREGGLRRMVVYSDRDEPLEAAGLRQPRADT